MYKKSTGHGPSFPVEKGQVAFLVRYSSIWFWGNLLSATLFTTLRWIEQSENLALLFGWYAAIMTTGMLGWSCGQDFRAEPNLPAEKLHRSAQCYLMYSTLTSALWGASGIILFAARIESQAVHVILLLGAVIAATPILALSRLALHLQLAITLLPISINLMMLEETGQRLLALAALMVGGLLAMASRSMTHLLHELHTTQALMQELMHTDPVTQIPNRRYFDQIFKVEWRRAARDKKPLALLMVDVDHFKRYNDQNGHHAGDQCLQIVAQCLKSVARRASDVVSRHGGEEFAVLLPDTALDDAMIVAERLRKAVEDQRIPHSDGSLPRIVTVSVGVSCCTPTSVHAASEIPTEQVTYPAMLLNSADRALYRAKRNGRNQISKEKCGQGNAPVSLPAQTATHAA